MNRAALIAGFLEQNGWSEAEQFPFGADFSPRRYARLVQPDNKRAVLMDVEANQKTPEFIVIAQALQQMGLSAPEIFAADADNGLVLMEDLGNRNFGQLIDAGADAAPLYRHAIDVLVHLHQKADRRLAFELDLPIFGGALLASQVELYLDDYVPYTMGREALPEEGEAFRAAWKQTLKGIDAFPQSLMLRDFMPDNLMDLPGREGVASVGLLDFQDAGLGPIAYDLASLCEMVRRDGGDALLPDMIAYYYEKAQPKIPREDFTRACTILSVQRHMRILGILARLSRNGQPEKLALAPRILGRLAALLKDEAVKPVREWVDKYARS